MDVLTDVLRTLRLQGTVYFQADFSAPWGMDIKAGAVANFHIVVGGSCWLRSSVAVAPLKLHEGDIVVFAHGDRHVLAHEENGEAPPAEQVLRELRVTPENQTIYGGDGKRTTLICGHFTCDRGGMHPLLRALPALLHLRSSDTEQAQWIATATQLALTQSASATHGSEAIVDRLAEALLIQVVRLYVERTAAPQGFLAALADPTLSRALELMHGTPARRWSLGELAREVGVSRSVLAQRFKTTLGEPPMSYLTQWRMHKAMELLRQGEGSIARVAEHVGYRSEWAFSKAFKRVLGIGPGAVRRDNVNATSYR